MESSSNQVRSHVSLKPSAMAVKNSIRKGISNIARRYYSHSLILFNVSEFLLVEFLRTVSKLRKENRERFFFVCLRPT